MLKEDFPNARIMTFGYNTNVQHGYHAVDQGNIFSYARKLLYALDARRRQALSRHLIFVAHSLGASWSRKSFGALSWTAMKIPRKFTTLLLVSSSSEPLIEAAGTRPPLEKALLPSQVVS